MQKDILMLTGWGATCKVWEPIIPALSNGCQINCLTPTWLSDSQIKSSLSDIEGYIERLGAMINAPVNIVAWSMGGLIAIKLATRFPALVRSISFIASVPKFVSADNQNTGIDFQWFNMFVDQYQSSPAETLKKFLTLQVKNDSMARDCLRVLKNACEVGDYDMIECGYGLNLLQQLDLSKQLQSLECKTLFVHGENDAVVNLQSAQYAASLSGAPLEVISGAGHAPHISRPSEVARFINNHL
ncbi:MAG: alpha/beta fold hydrolase [Gammaproteobacteria bacterium]|nr:alpha/beta fold hydrolase [Gammaproteobacteria bacterium]